MTKIKQRTTTIAGSTGFTLIELMIVIAIIGILMAIGIPSYKNHIRKAHYTEITRATLPYKLSIEECFQIHTDLSQCEAGKNAMSNYTNTSSHGLVHSITISSGGVITVTPNNLYGITPNDTYILTPTVLQSRLLWTPSGGGVTNGYN